MSGPAGSWFSPEDDLRRGRHRQGATDAAWIPRVPQDPPSPGRHALPAKPSGAASALPPDSPSLAEHSPHAVSHHDNQPPYPPSAKPERGKGRKLVNLSPSITELSPIDSFADTNSHGLCMFNIGMVPASVTPPTTTRRAAWFSVLASTGVLVALISLSAALVGPPKSTEQIGLPGVPGNAPQFPADSPDDLSGGPASSSSPTGRHSWTSGTSLRVHGTGRPAGGGRETSGDREPGGGSNRPSPTGWVTGPTQPAPPPEIIIVPTGPRRTLIAPRTADGQQMADRTVRYFRLVTTDPVAAYQLTDGSLSIEELKQRYSDVSSIQVRTIRSDPNLAVTRTELTMTKADGTSINQQRTLTFTPTNDPKIYADS